MRDLFSQCTYVCVCHAQECQFAHVTELIRHRTRTSRNSYITCTDTVRENIGSDTMPSLATSDGGQRRTALLDNGGRVGKCGWSSAMYEFCRVEYRTQPMVCGIEKEKSRYSRS